MPWGRSKRLVVQEGIYTAYIYVHDHSMWGPARPSDVYGGWRIYILYNSDLSGRSTPARVLYLMHKILVSQCYSSPYSSETA